MPLVLLRFLCPFAPGTLLLACRARFSGYAQITLRCRTVLLIQPVYGLGPPGRHFHQKAVLYQPVERLIRVFQLTMHSLLDQSPSRDPLEAVRSLWVTQKVAKDFFCQFC